MKILHSSRSIVARLVLALTLALLLLSPVPVRAGGPEYVAGNSFFNAGMAGQPLTWPQGVLVYYTDQGDLSPILPGAAADALVADAFSQWTAVPTAAIVATRGGQLGEDVSGANVSRNADNSLSMPQDIQPGAAGNPIGIVYDSDGSVTDALLGSGAGDAGQCFFNAAYGGADAFAASANFQHALVVINGQCAQQSSQLTDLEYRLVRALGTVIGLGWSQLNVNVITGRPHPTADDFAGFPVMHSTDSYSCVPITICFPNPYQIALDDAAALSRLYPVTVQNQAQFPSKLVLSSATAAIHGSVWFTDSKGNPTQPMQGVNVVARWVDPRTGLPSGRYAASAVSGYLFTGNAGNTITGFSDPLGTAYSEYGSTNPAVEGFFEIQGLNIPNGGATAQYQLSVEPLDTTWSGTVEPYAPFQVTPSGPLPAPVFVNVTLGTDVAQDILMVGSAQPVPPWSGSETWDAPAPVPAAGDWEGSINGYGDTAYFSMPAQSNRTLSIAVTALDEADTPTEGKLQPLIGMWALTDPEGIAPPAFSPSPFNTGMEGLTRLDAQVINSIGFRIGIADLRGDGRPDYRYQAHVLYADSVEPLRSSANGGPVTIKGVGFFPGLLVSVGNRAATTLAITAGQMVVALPTDGDGPQDIMVSDPATGSFSTMSGAITIGAAASDSLLLLRGPNPITPVGTQAANPVSVRAVAADGVTPVAGASIGWSATNGVLLAACGGASSCVTYTDNSGIASTAVTPGSIGTATITATLAPGVYSAVKSVSANLVSSSSSSDIGVINPLLWIAQGATMSLPLTVRAVSNAVAHSGVGINFTIAQGSGTLSAATVQTDSNGYATTTLSVTNFASVVQVAACVAPSNSPCQTFAANPVAGPALKLQTVSGTNQAITLDEAFQPLVLRVTDSSTPANAVAGVNVAFQSTVIRPQTGSGTLPVILSVSQANVPSDMNGLTSILPSVGTFTGTLVVDVSATTAAGTMNWALQAFPAAAQDESRIPASGLKYMSDRVSRR